MTSVTQVEVDREFWNRFVDACEGRRSRLGSLAESDTAAAARALVRECHDFRGEAGLLGLTTIADATALLLERLEKDGLDLDRERLGSALDWMGRLLSAAVTAALDGSNPGEGDPLGLADWMRAPPRLTGGHRVLVLEDSEIAREMVVLELEARDFEVRSAGDLVEFEMMLKKFDPEIILSDVRLPETHGDEVCRVLKERLETKNIPIILFSAMSHGELAQIAKRAGADGFISKEQGVQRLIECIDEVLAQIVY